MLRTIVCFSLLLPSLASQVVLEVEPDNTAATAQVVAMGSQVNAFLSAGDVDWYRITTVGGNVRITVNGFVDSRLTLWNSTGVLTLAANDDCRGLLSDLSLNLAAGVYAVQVTGYSPLTAGNYSLDVSLESPSKPFTDIESEPNGLVSQAQPIGGSAQVSGILSNAADVDVYRIDLTAPLTGVRIRCCEGDSPWVSQHRIEMWDAAGAPVAEATLGGSAVDSGEFSFRTDETRCWPAGTYHVVVRNRSVGQAFNPVPLGRYRLEVLSMPMSVGSPVSESAEPNDALASATPIAPGQSGNGGLTFAAGDVTDLWGPITIVEPSTMMVQTAAGISPGILDTTIRLLQQDPVDPTMFTTVGSASMGNILEGPGTSHARAQFTFFVPGLTYFIAVDAPGAGPGQSGGYRLDLSTLASAPYLTAGYSVVAANTSCGVAPFPTIAGDYLREAPTIGQTLSRQVSGLEPSGLCLLIQGTDNIAPFDVGGITGSAPGSCFLNVNVLFTAPAVADIFGQCTLYLTIPANGALRGAILWEQIVKVNSSAVPFLQMGNYARIFVGDRSY